MTTVTPLGFVLTTSVPVGSLPRYPRAAIVPTDAIAMSPAMAPMSGTRRQTGFFDASLAESAALAIEASASSPGHSSLECWNMRGALGTAAIFGMSLTRTSAVRSNVGSGAAGSTAVTDSAANAGSTALTAGVEANGSPDDADSTRAMGSMVGASSACA